MPDLKPITRKEKYLSAMAGNNTAVPTPVTREENFLNAILEKGGPGGGASFEALVVDALPTTGQSGVLYLVPNGGANPNIYDEYVWIESSARYEKIGTTEVDLSQYAKTTDVNAALAGKVDKEIGKVLSSNDYTTAEKDKLAGMETGAQKNPSEATTEVSGLMSASDKQQLAAQEQELAYLRELVLGIDAPIYRSASGNPVVVYDGYPDAPLRSLTVHIEPMQAGSGDPSPDNVRPFSGYAGISLLCGGKNLMQYTDSNRTLTQNGITWTAHDDGSITADGTTTADNSTFVFWRPTSEEAKCCNGLILSGSAPGDFTRLCFEQGRSPYGSFAWTGNGSSVAIHTVDDPGPCNVYVRIQGQGIAVSNLTFYPMIRAARIADATYAPYVRTDTLSVSFGEAGTVYGGTLDVTGGLLTVTHGHIASYAGEPLPGQWLSSMDVYEENKTPTTGAQVVYELAEPVAYHLTGQEWTTLSGINTISAGYGNVSVTYRAAPTPGGV